MDGGRRFEIDPEDVRIRPGDIVKATIHRSDTPASPALARVKTIQEHMNRPEAVSQFVIDNAGFRIEFPAEVLAEANSLKAPADGELEDFTELPLYTIDPANARDRDDAIGATGPDEDGNRMIYIAIADVSYYVKRGSALDREARERGNSIYFPDRVIPMLPERLSNDLCSLNPRENRPARLWTIKIGPEGEILESALSRGMIRSREAFNYQEVSEAVLDGKPNEKTAPHKDHLVNILKAGEIRRNTRERQNALHLNAGELEIDLSGDGVWNISLEVRNSAHEAVEEFMLAAGICAAEMIEETGVPCIYRVHDQMPAERVEAALRDLEELGYPLKQDKLSNLTLNGILAKAKGSQQETQVIQTIVRLQSLAHYSTENIGHAGLGLRVYTQFTSPIRRYGDLEVHRALDGDTAQLSHLQAVAEHISSTEQMTAQAERQASSLYARIFGNGSPVRPSSPAPQPVVRAGEKLPEPAPIC